MDQLSQSTRALLREGLTSYPEALIALREFQTQIQEDCQAILRRHVVELRRAMGRPTAAAEVKPYAWGNEPRKINLRESVELGAQWQITGVNNIYLAFYAAIGWWSDDDITIEPYATAFLETDRHDLLSALAQRLDAQGRQDFDRDLASGYILTSEKTSPDDPEACLSTVETMVVKWITLWDEIGGFQAVLPLRSRTS